MGDDNKEEAGKVTPRRDSIYDFTEGERNRQFGSQSDLEREFIPQSQSFYNAYSSAAGRQRQDYDTMMGGYGDWRSGVNNLSSQIAQRRPQAITYNRSGDMQNAMTGYNEFAKTGGYSPQDIQEMRARGMSPIRSAYGNTMMEMDRARALGGPGGSANYIAAASKAQRELPGQLADATTNVNATLAQDIRQGRLAGMQGLQQGSLAEAGLDQRAKELTEQGLSAWEARQLASQEMSLRGLEGQRSLYGTAPGMASTFGNQALQAYQQRSQMEQLRQNTGLGLIDMQLRSLGQQAPPGTPWWQTALNAGTNLAGTMIGMPGGAI
jgi:hypothetical protein